MKSIKPIYNQNDLLIFFKKVRLETDKENIRLKLEENKKVEGENLKAKEKISNFWKDTKTFLSGSERKENLIDDNLRHFNTKYINVINDSTSNELVKSLFTEDKYGLAKLLFSVSVILDSEYKYNYEKEGLAKVSQYLYGNANELSKIKDSLYESYKAVSPSSLSSIQKGALFGVAIASMVGVITLPILIGGGVAASASTTTAILAAKGFGDMQIGLGVISAEAIMIGATMTGACYGGMKLYNREQIKKEFKKLTPEKESMYLAIQCVYIERIKKTVNDEEFKEQLDTLLKSMNTLKSDLDYFYFVEKEDTKNNRIKMEIFHKFDLRLSKILGL